MSNSKLVKLEFSREAVAEWKEDDAKHRDWPVVYVLYDEQDRSVAYPSWLRDIYVGESLHAATRLRQHLETPAKQHLKKISVVLDDRFNKSACLDLESYLIRMLAGDGANRVLNRNNGVTESRYYRQEMYRKEFRSIFDQLRADGIFTRTIPQIENSDLFKLSPFKALTEDQADSVHEIVKGLFLDLERRGKGTMVIQGDPGTGKTVVAIYMIKLLVDIMTYPSLEDLDSDSYFAEFFTDANRERLQGLRIGLVVPQQSLRETIKNVFQKTPGLHPSMVMKPFEVGLAEGMFDILLVDEAHRLRQRASEPSGVLNAQFATITHELFGSNDNSITQLDWILAKGRHQIFLLDTAQSIRPADLPTERLLHLVAEARKAKRHFQLRTQMRVKAGSDYVAYVRRIFDLRPLAELPLERQGFGDYEFCTFDSLKRMRKEIFRHEAKVGLSRVVAGYAWEWKTKKNKQDIDIKIGPTSLRWNSTQTDWISSKKALKEVGSIHTVQGYDLNYVGVIIGPDLRFNWDQKCLSFDRASYFDKKGKQNSPALGKKYTDDQLLRFVTQIYGVLMTRGIRGTYVYACDPGLRKYLKAFIPSHPKGRARARGPRNTYDKEVRRARRKRARRIYYDGR